MFPTLWILKAYPAVAQVSGFLCRYFHQQLIYQTTRCRVRRAQPSPKQLKLGNQVQAGNQESPFYFLLNLFHNTCGSNLVSTASTDHPPTSAKKQPQKVIARKHPPKAKSRAITRPYTAPAIEIRVAIAPARSQSFASSTEASIIDGNGQALEQLPPSEAVQISVSGSNILFQKDLLPSTLWIEPTDGGVVFVGNSWYRGKLLLIAQGDKLLAINYVNLEEYLLSVVGSEMSAAAPMEALKAQAVAARSYALVHTFRPASQWFDVTSGERHQAYKGIATEYDTTHQGVSETTGEILSYQGGVVESLYAATQAIVDKAHKGAGMSQTGAYAYASQG